MFHARVPSDHIFLHFLVIPVSAQHRIAYRLHCWSWTGQVQHPARPAQQKNKHKHAPFTPSSSRLHWQMFKLMLFWYFHQLCTFKKRSWKDSMRQKQAFCSAVVTSKTQLVGDSSETKEANNYQVYQKISMGCPCWSLKNRGLRERSKCKVWIKTFGLIEVY